MTKVRAALAQYNEIRQSTETTRYSLTNQSGHQSISLNKLCLSGKRASIYAPNLPLFGYESHSTAITPKMEFTSTANLNSNKVTNLIFEIRGTQILNRSSIENSQEVSLPAGHEARLMEHRIGSNDAAQTWTLDVRCETYKMNTPLDMNTLHTAFIPISRNAIIQLTGIPQNQSNTSVDPFAVPSKQTGPSSTEGSIEDILKRAGIRGDSVAFDGEQLIIRAKQSTIEHLQQMILELDYVAPITGTLDFRHENEDGIVINHLTKLTSNSGKRSEFTIRNETQGNKTYNLLSGTELTFTPKIQHSNDLSENELSADFKWMLKVPDHDVPWSLQMSHRTNKYTSEQSLPPVNQHSWKLERLKAFE